MRRCGITQRLAPMMKLPPAGIVDGEPFVAGALPVVLDQWSLSALLACPPAHDIAQNRATRRQAMIRARYGVMPSVRTGDTATPESVVSIICPLPMNSATLWLPSGP